MKLCRGHREQSFATPPAAATWAAEHRHAAAEIFEALAGLRSPLVSDVSLARQLDKCFSRADSSGAWPLILSLADPLA